MTGNIQLKRLLTASVCVGLLAAASPALANATFTDSSGQYSVGIGPDGELYDDTTGVGLRNPAGSDYIAPGTPRDSWGVVSSQGSAFADYHYTGTSGILGTVTTTGANTATTSSATAAGLLVNQTFAFLQPNIVSVQETLTNTSGATLNGIIFERDVDLDIAPTAFNEDSVGPFGSNANVLATSDYGFENPNPANGLLPFGPGDNEFNSTFDSGAGIDYSVGSLLAGDVATFVFYYGINEPGQSLAGLFGEAATEGLNYYIGDQSSENGNYPGVGAGAGLLGVSSFGTVATVGVPEPLTLSLFGAGLAGAAAMRRRKKANKA